MAALPGQALQYHQDEEDHLHRNINHNYFIHSTVHKIAVSKVISV